MQEQKNDLFDSDIDFLVEDAIEECKIEHSWEDITSISQSQYNYLLSYIGKRVFYKTNILKEDNNVNNKYSIPKVKYVLDVYCEKCYLYDKEISIIGFTRFTGIAQENIYQWANESSTRRDGTRKLSNEGLEIYQKLNAGRQESLSNRLLSGKSNPVGTIAILNHAFGWSSPYVAEKPQQTQRIARTDIQKTIGESSTGSDALPQLPE